MATGKKQRLGEGDNPLHCPHAPRGRGGSCPGVGGARARRLGASSASPGDAPLGLDALHPGVVYVLELKVVVHSGPVDAHGDGDGPQPIR